MWTCRYFQQLVDSEIELAKSTGQLNKGVQFLQEGATLGRTKTIWQSPQANGGAVRCKLISAPVLHIRHSNVCAPALSTQWHRLPSTMPSCLCQWTVSHNICSAASCKL